MGNSDNFQIKKFQIDSIQVFTDIGVYIQIRHIVMMCKFIISSYRKNSKAFYSIELTIMSKSLI